MLDAAGAPVPIVMGSYGIGVERNLAAAVEMNHDDQGIVWPVAIAPYEVVITVLKLDEPTMGLSLKETEKLLNFVRGIKEAGKSAVFIDHNIFHVYSVSDRVVVIDRGQVAGEFHTKDISLEELMEKMIHVAETGSLDNK